MNDEIKKIIKRKNWLFQGQRKSCKLDFAVLNSLTQDISDAIKSSKLKYYEHLANKLNNPKTAPKTYWKILKTFLNDTKIPLIPPLLVGKLFSGKNVYEQVELFNKTLLNIFHNFIPNNIVCDDRPSLDE